MKRILSIMIIAALTVSFAACAGKGGSSVAPTEGPGITAGTASTPEPTEEPLDPAEEIVGVWQLDHHLTIAQLDIQYMKKYKELVDKGFSIRLTFNADGTAVWVESYEGTDEEFDITYRIEDNILFLQFPSGLSAYMFELEEGRLYLWTHGYSDVFVKTEG